MLCARRLLNRSLQQSRIVWTNGTQFAYEHDSTETITFPFFVLLHHCLHYAKGGVNCLLRGPFITQWNTYDIIVSHLVNGGLVSVNTFLRKKLLHVTCKGLKLSMYTSFLLILCIAAREWLIALWPQHDSEYVKGMKRYNSEATPSPKRGRGRKILSA